MKYVCIMGGSDWLHFGWRWGFLALASLRPDGFAGLRPQNPNLSAIVGSRVSARGERFLKISADIDPYGWIKVSISLSFGALLEEHFIEKSCIDAAVSSAKLDWSEVKEIVFEF